MSKRQKAYSSYEFRRILRANGFEWVRNTGDHYVYKRGTETVVIAQKLNKMIAQRLIKEHKLETEI